MPSLSPPAPRVKPARTIRRGQAPLPSSPGVLTITAQQTTAAQKAQLYNYDYTSGLLTTEKTFAQTYGYFEMRADVPLAAGAWPAFWLIPADGSWPPEFDIMETLSKDPFAAYQTEHSGIGGHSSNGVMSFVPGARTLMPWYSPGLEFMTSRPQNAVYEP